MTDTKDVAEREVWKPVIGAEGRYEVSSLGRVRSLRHRSGPLIMSPTANHNGYLRVTILGRLRFVHRLVLESFVGPKPDGYCAAHWNARRADNRVSNLRWATIQENCADIARHGSLKGERHCSAKLTSDKARLIRQLHTEGSCPDSQLAMLFNVTRHTVGDVIRRRNWKHVP